LAPRITFATNCGSLPTIHPTIPPSIPNNFSIDIAAELMQLCVCTYDQYTAHQTSKSWTIPSPYIMEKVLYAYEKNQQDVSIKVKVPFGFIVSKTLNTNTDLYICFRGTRGAQEWEKDAKVPLTQCSFLVDEKITNIKVHEGFQEVYTNPNNVDESLGSLQSQVLDFLKNSVPNYYSNLWVTGHSLGAALATLAIADIVTNVNYPGAKMYNFASPLVGNQAFVVFFKSNIGTSKCDGNNNINTCSWRVVNTNDLVPKVPDIFGYAHVNGCSGTSICNNRIDKNNENNGLFEITFAEECKNLFKDATCFGNAHKADTYLSTLLEIKNPQK
jgi:triacylglycerol lipase